MIEPQSLTPVPRAARMREGHREARRAWAVAAVVAGALLLAFLLLNNVRWQQLAHHGVAVQGKVTAHRQVRGKGVKSLLTVEFPFGEGTREVEFSASGDVYERYNDGDTIPVVVDPQEARNAELFAFTPEDANGLLLRGGLAWLAGGTLVALAFWADANAVEGQRRMLAEWPLGWLDVDRVLPAEAKQSGLYLEGHYEDGEGRTRHVGRLHLPSGFQARERLPVLCDPLSDAVVALAALDKVEIA